MRAHFTAPAAALALACSAAVYAQPPALFQTSDRCQACHNGLVSAAGEDVSIGRDWRPSMMANSARDPYWQAAVRREVMDHPSAAAAIEHECSRCHMPMAHVTSVTAGGRGNVLASTTAPLAADGVSCTVCHQIVPDKLGTPESFTGHFTVDTSRPWGNREIAGPFAVDDGRARIMQSAAEFRPVQASHLQSSEMCATCHTLFTHAFDAAGQVVGELPEQVPYLEWRHSRYRETQSCASCHMPPVQGAMPISSTLGDPREPVSRHAFRGANAFMMRILDRNRAELGVVAPGPDIDRAATDTLMHLQSEAALIAIDPVARGEDRLEFTVDVRNLAGHKLPTAYPSRRAWLHVVVLGPSERVLFESGAPRPDGSIADNDNDADAGAYEPHYSMIERAEQVQIYEAVLADHAGAVTTGLLSGTRYLKDNRLLPEGFDKRTAEEAVEVHGTAAADGDFIEGGDRVRFLVPVSGGGPFTIRAELLYQSIGYRWAQNLRRQRSGETDRFVRLYESMAETAATRLAHAAAEVK